METETQRIAQKQEWATGIIPTLSSREGKLNKRSNHWNDDSLLPASQKTQWYGFPCHHDQKASDICLSLSPFIFTRGWFSEDQNIDGLKSGQKN